MKFSIPALVLALALGACSSAPEPETGPGEIGLAPGRAAISEPVYGQPIRLDVARVQVAREYRVPRGVGGAVSVDLGDYIDRWAARRIDAVGQGGRVRLIVEAAMVDERFERKALPKTMEFERYRVFDGAVRIRIEVTDPATQRIGFASARAHARHELAEDADEDERDALRKQIGNQLLMDMDKSLEDSVRANLKAFLR